MSDDWKVGDLAVCVDNSPCPFGTPMPMAIGQIGRVIEFTSRDCLKLDATANANCKGWYKSRFRKIRPDAHEACEAEFATLLKRSKRKVEA